MSIMLRHLWEQTNILYGGRAGGKRMLLRGAGLLVEEARVLCRECEYNVAEVSGHLCLHCRLDHEDRAAGRYREDY